MGDIKRVRRLLDDLRRQARRVAEGATPGAAALTGLLGEIERDAAALEGMLAEVERDARVGALARRLAVLFARQSAPREFCRAALDVIGESLDAGSGYVLSFAADGGEAEVLAERGGEDGDRNLSRSLLAEVVARRETVLLSDARTTPFARETSVQALDLRSVMVTPLLIEGEVQGAIYLENRSTAHAFGDDDRPLLEAIAQILAPYIHVGSRLDTALEERARLAARLEGSSRALDIVGRGPATIELLATIERLKDQDIPVLIEGESGTGKELVARALHYSGRRAAAAFVAVNCAAIPEGLMESELFGHERGAFTGASERRRGCFEQAHGGTLFLDEVGELRYDLQAKLLRVLQERSFTRLGGSALVEVDVRLVAASNRDLRQLVSEGRFREDLYYRVYVVPIKVPPLRERREDIRPLIEHFLREANLAAGKNLVMAPEVYAVLEAYRYPGNVRELKNLVSRLVALGEAGWVRAADLPSYVRGEEALALNKDPFKRFLRTPPRTNEELKLARDEMSALYDRYVRELEARFLKGLLDRAKGNISEAARLAGMNRTLFHRKLRDTRSA